MYAFGWRDYDPSIGRWNVIDPMSERRYGLTTYNYVQNSPMIRFDPNGLTDFTLNKKTGDVKQVGEANENPDRILKTNKKGEVKYNKKGEAKVAFGGIEQGILKDGQNFKDKDQLMSVGGKNQPTVEGVKSFTLNLSEYLGKEIKGYSYSSNDSKNVTDIVLGKYKMNDYTTSYGTTRELAIKYKSNYTSNNVIQEFHTHPDGKLGATESDPSLSQDVTSMKNGKLNNPNANTTYIILYRIPEQVQPAEYDYTNN